MDICCKCIITLLIILNIFATVTIVKLTEKLKYTEYRMENLVVKINRY